MADRNCEYVWIVDTDWVLTQKGVCRRCGNSAVASFRIMHHSHTSGTAWPVRYGYCSEHLYVRVIADGRVWMEVSRDSPKAKTATEMRVGLLPGRQDD